MTDKITNRRKRVYLRWFNTVRVKTSIKIQHDKTICRIEREFNWELAVILWITKWLWDTRRWTTQHGDCHMKSSGEYKPPLLLAVSQRRENSKELLPYQCFTPSLKSYVSHFATTSHQLSHQFKLMIK